MGAVYKALDRLAVPDPAEVGGMSFAPAARMVARAIFRASLEIGSERVGVKLYSAAAEKDVHFHLLHEPDGARVHQRMVNPVTGETVASEDAIRAVEVDRGVFVALSDEELARFRPEPSRAIRVESFVGLEDLDPRLYERPYLLGPEDTQAARYFACAEAIAKSGRQGIARWVMRNRAYRGALRVEGEHLALVALRSSDELVATDSIRVAAGRDLDEREIALARQLIESLAGPFDPTEFKDEYRERVLAYIADKAKGKRVRLRRYEPSLVRDDDLVAALKASLRKAG